MLLSAAASSGLATPDNRPWLAEHGFWDYTTPGAGGMEAYGKGDYASLLDDMAEAGMKSLLVCPRWFTTGYRSRLPYLDQLPSNRVIASGNELLRWVLDEARKRQIKTWLSAYVCGFEPRAYGLKPYRSVKVPIDGAPTVEIGIYDLDTPGVAERAVEIFDELVREFPMARALNVELEDSGIELPHRIPLYNKWAAENGRPPFERLGHPLNPRLYDVPAWRDYDTHRRIQILRAIEAAVRARGFRGDLGMICETANSTYSITQEVNLREYHAKLPHWIAVTYEYDKWRHRFGVMDVSIATPKQEGLKVYYLPRGVMTWGRWPLPITLEESWSLDVEDVLRFRPDGLWWFGSGAANEGLHVSVKRLREAGYADSRQARRALLKKVAALRAAS
jgi:hypothetical protein